MDTANRKRSKMVCQKAVNDMLRKEKRNIIEQKYEILPIKHSPIFMIPIK